MSTVSHSGDRDGGLERIYVWELPVRLSHWLVALSIVVLSATGYYIGHPFISVPGAAAGDHFVMGTVRAVHLYAASVFVAAIIVRAYWWFAGNSYSRWSDFIPVSRRRFRSLWQSFKFYSFISREPDDYPGHNALAAGSYAMIFAVYALLIVTGLVLHAYEVPPGSPFHVFGRLAPWFFGLPMTRLIHHVAMWVVLIFVVVHLHFVLLASLIERVGTFESIFSGYKFFPRKKSR